ncbi:hypothetical protein O181_055870 [Austropuccinia psidii MF-1]|uniref:Uncharacterized protein n=1 Tax=Austropuccinia psidii MF-1 TaxID=1389203 RepID=A0A9Q3EBM8_9BASI|nr:hypothetical protein [Austropuccinia psidii MF-1]
MEARKQEWELLSSLWIGKLKSYLKVRNCLGTKTKQELLKGWAPISCKGRFPKIEYWLITKTMVSEDQKKELVQRGNSPVEAPQASPIKNPPQQTPSTGRKAPNRNQKSNKKAKGKGKPKWNKPYLQNNRTPKK